MDAKVFPFSPLPPLIFFPSISFPRLHSATNQVKLFLQLYVLGVCALDIKSLLHQPRAFTRLRRSFERCRTGSLGFAILSEHSFDHFGPLLNSLFKLRRALFQTLSHRMKPLLEG